jgi:nucleotide-binding universal stress UspA family protein
MQTSNILTAERSTVANRVDERAAEPIKSIVFVVHDDEGLQRRLQAALSLARACSAHLQLLHVVPVEAYTVVDTYGGAFASGEIVDVLTKEARKLQQKLEKHLEVEDVSWGYEVTLSTMVPALLRGVALADMVFIGRSPPYHEATRTGPGLVADLICGGRAPICVPGDRADNFDPFGKAMIAWNGSVEAANAVRSVIGLLRMASEVRVLSFKEKMDPIIEEAELLNYLSRHGVHAELDKHKSSDVSADLIRLSSRFGAEYIVMGGYSHSRAGEYLFGGVTREFLKGCPITLVLSH